MTNNSDSSTPNSPDLTGLSGEQTEERTAREGRKFGEHDEPLSRPDGHNPYWCGGDMAGQCCFDDPCWSCISFLHEAAENALTECSRLASRVEELEAKCAEWETKFKAQRSARRFYKKSLNRRSKKVVKKA